MLSGKVKTTAELMSIALQAERQTTQRYSRLAESMRAVGNESAAALFERMVDEEREHERRLLEWMASEAIAEVPGIGPIHWRDPQVATHYDDEARDPHHSTPYKALAYAVNNEENAFRFYTHVASETDNAAVQKCAEALAREELEHAELFRAERRLAYHAERDAGKLRSMPDTATIPNEATLLALAIAMDRRLVDAVDSLATHFHGAADPGLETRQQIGVNKAFLDSATLQGEEISQQGLAAAHAQIESKEVYLHLQAGDAERELQRLEIYCDRCFVFYDAIAEATEDESILHTAQRLAISALEQADWFRQLR